MKKKLFLLALPALMALSSCTYLASGNAQPKGNFFKEAADAQQEIFGGQEKALQVRAKAPNRSAAGDMLEPVIGVQYKTKYDISETATPDYRIAVRFVAAIKSLDVNATWTRAVYDNNGAIDGTESTITITKAYTKLNSDGDPITPAEFAGDASYKYFVAYTLYNIPFDEVNDYYIVANVTLSDNSGSLPSVSSKAKAARIGGNVTFEFQKNTSGYFLAGTIGGVANSTLASIAPTGSNVARFSGTLAANDAFYIVDNDTANSEFNVYDSSKIALTNPYFVDDGASSHKIKVVSTQPFKFDVNSSNQLCDIDIGFTVSYTNNSEELVEDVAMIYSSTDGGGVNQFAARIAPKSGSQLAFKFRGEAINAPAEPGANASGSPVEITYGAPSIDLYLKDFIGTYTLWATYPASSFTLYVNDEPSAVESDVPAGWEDKAVFELNLPADATVKVKWGYSLISAPSTTTKASLYRVYFHSNNTVSFDFVHEYCLVGKINGNAAWSGNTYPLTSFPDGDGQYTLVNNVHLIAGDAIKVRGGNGDGAWYPDGDGNNYNITEDGDYQIYFKPGGNVGGWHYGYFWVSKL